MNPKEVLKRATGLSRMIKKGQVTRALETYYHPQVVMQENSEEPTVGLQANMDREKHFDDVTQWHAAELKSLTVNEDVSMAEWYLDFTNKDYGKRMAFTQVAVQHWKDGKIIKENFYYNPESYHH